MDTGHLTSAAFWNDPGHFAAGAWEGGLPELPGCGGSVIFKTSGSTGEGKWIVVEKKALRVSARAVNDWLEVGAESVWGIALPTDHVGGFAILTRVFEAGCGLSVFPGKWNPVEFASWISRNGITHTSLVPTQVHDLIRSGTKAPGCLRAVVVGGGRLEDRSGQAARDLGWPVLASYGMTEAASQIATQSMAALRLAFSESPLEILPIWQAATDAGQLLSIFGEALFSGTIAGNGEGFRFVPRPPGAFPTNDRVYLEGNALKPLGRVDSLVKILGVLVDIEAVERRFLEIASGRVAEGRFAIVPLRDSRSEHVLAAVFEGDEPVGYVDEYNSSAPGTERVTRSFVIESFPRTHLGKLRRKALAERCEGK